MSTKTDYRVNASDDAANFVDYFIDEVVEKLIEDGEASDDFLNDYPGGDSYHHATHIDQSYDLQESAKILDDLDEYEETDDGLWEGLKPREAISAQAAYTYGNAVYSMACDIIKEINGDDEVETAIDNITTLSAFIMENAEEDNASSDDEVNEIKEKMAELYPDEPSLTQEQAIEKTKAMLTTRVKAIIEENR